MAVILPFPIHRTQASSRARRVFQAQMQLERAQKHAMLFFGMAVVSVGAMMSMLEIASRLR